MIKTSFSVIFAILGIVLCAAIAPAVIILMILAACVLGAVAYGVTVLLLPFYTIYGIATSIADGIRCLFGKKTNGHNDKSNNCGKFERFDGYRVNDDGIIDMYKTAE